MSSLNFGLPNAGKNIHYIYIYKRLEVEKNLKQNKESVSHLHPLELLDIQQQLQITIINAINWTLMCSHFCLNKV